MVNCEALIHNFMDYSEENFECEAKGQYLVLTTPFAYYDGDHIQVFIREISADTIEISDLGHAVRKLNAAGINVSGARTRQSRLDAIMQSRGVDFDRGRLFTNCEKSKFADHLIRLVQAMLQTDDLIFSRATPSVRSFSTEIEDRLKSTGLEYKRSIRLRGAYGNRNHEFDFQLDLPTLTIIKGLSAVSNFGADDQANRLLGALADLKPQYPTFQPLVFLDETSEVSWNYAEGILKTITNDVYRFQTDAEKLTSRLISLYQSAA